MRIIIAGGSGMIGKRLGTDLAGSGHEVIGLSRYPERASDALQSGMRLEKWDGKSAAGWGHLADGADVLINLAGENIGAGRWTAKRKNEIISSRVNSGGAIVEAVRLARQKPGLVIQSSGVDYYGVHGAEPIDESYPAGDAFLSEVCTQWEGATREVEDFRVRRVVYRGAVVLTLDGGAFPRILLPFKLFAGGPLGSGSQWFSWIHMDDQIAALRWIIDNPSASGVYNFAAPDPIQNKVLARTIGKVMRRPAFFAVPAFAIRLLFGEMAITVLGGQRVLPGRLEQEGFRFQYPKIEQAIRSLV